MSDVYEIYEAAKKRISNEALTAEEYEDKLRQLAEKLGI